jgi:type I restriction enzyme S subunit
LVAADAPICYGILMPGRDTEGGIPVVKVRDYDHDGIDAAKLLRAEPHIEASYPRSRLAPGDILLSIRGTTGVVAMVPAGLAGANITQDTARIRVEASDRNYVFQALQAPNVRKQIRLHTIGQAVKGINIGAVRQLQIPWPEKDVRDLIARVLGDCDSLTRATGRLVDLKREFKRGLLQQVLAGKKRFPAFIKRPWPMGRFDSLCEEVSDRNGNRLSADRVMGVIKNIGFQPMRERVRGKGGLVRYKVVPPGGFAYNPMRLNIGSIAYNDLGHELLVSPDYEVFRVRSQIANPEFINQLRYSSFWAGFMKRAGAGSVRVRIYFGDLARLRVPTPELDEQERIAEVMRLLDAELDRLARLRAATQLYKRALFSTLLAGELASARS